MILTSSPWDFPLDKLTLPTVVVQVRVRRCHGKGGGAVRLAVWECWLSPSTASSMDKSRLVICCLCEHCWLLLKMCVCLHSSHSASTVCITTFIFLRSGCSCGCSGCCSNSPQAPPKPPFTAWACIMHHASQKVYHAPSIMHWACLRSCRVARTSTSPPPWRVIWHITSPAPATPVQLLRLQLLSHT